MSSRVQVATFASIRRSRLRQAMAVLLIVLIVLPFTAPFATFASADITRAAMVGADDSQKLKTSSQDFLVASLSSTTVPHSFSIAAHIIVVEAEADSRQPRRAVLRL